MLMGKKHRFGDLKEITWQNAAFFKTRK